MTTSLIKQTFWIRKFDQYSNPEIFQRKFAQDPAHVNLRIAGLFRALSTLPVTPEAIKHFFTVIKDAGLFLPGNFVHHGLPVLKSLQTAILAKDSATAVRLIESGAPVLPEDMLHAMRLNLFDVYKAMWPKLPKPSFTPWLLQNGQYEFALEQLLGNLQLAYDADEQGRTFAHYAAKGGIAAIIYVLFNSNTFTDAPDKNGKTPLMDACENGHIEVVRMLLPKSTITATDKNGYTALHFAARNGHNEIILLLLQSVPEKDKKAFIDAKTSIEKATALQLTCHNTTKHSDCACLLIEAGADLQANPVGWTPLHQAAYNGMIDVITLILSKIQPPYLNQQAVFRIDTISHPTTAFMIACHSGHLDIAIALLRKGTDVMQSDWGNCTPLHVAAFNGWHQFIPELLSHVPEGQRITFLNKKDNLLRSALTIAAFQGHDLCIRAILIAYADIGVEEEQSRTLLHLLAQKADRDNIADLIVLILKTTPQDIRHKMLSPLPNQYETPLRYALHALRLGKGKASIAIMLIEAGAPVATPEGNLSDLLLATFCHFSDPENVEKLLMLIYSKIPDEKKQQCLNSSLYSLLYLTTTLPADDKAAIERGEILDWQWLNLHFLLDREAFIEDLPAYFLDLCDHYWLGNRLFFHYLKMLPAEQQRACLEAKTQDGFTPLALALRKLITTNSELNVRLIHELLEMGADVDEAVRLLQNGINLVKILQALIQINGFDSAKTFFNPSIYESDSDLRFLFNRPEFSEMTCMIQGEEFHLSSTLLTKKCKIFQLNIPGTPRDLSPMVNEEDLSYFKSMLEFLYSGSLQVVEIDHDRFKGLARIANMFICESLIQKLQKWLVDHPECERWNQLFESAAPQKGTKRPVEAVALAPAAKKKA